MRQGDDIDCRRLISLIVANRSRILSAAKIGELIKFFRALPMEKRGGSLFYAEIARTRHAVKRRMPRAAYLIEADKEAGRRVAFTKLDHKAAIIGRNT